MIHPSIMKGVHDELTSKATHLQLEKKQVYEKSADDEDSLLWFDGAHSN